MACCSIDLSLANLVLLGALVFGVKKLIAYYQKWKLEEMLEKYSNTPKDKVILHTMGRCRPLPTISPYALKVETYLRLAKIPYELETTDFRGAKGKMPWITYNGTHVADSHLCIQFLNKKLGINLNNGKSQEAVATAKASRTMLENHFSWAVVQYRWVENIGSIGQLWKLTTPLKFMIPFIGRGIKKAMDTNGMGKHTPTEIYQMTEEDLYTVSTLLGNKKFFGGDEPCEDDCGVFGCLAQVVWGMPGSAFERLIHGELRNLKQYCDRVKDVAWPDWENCLDKS